MFDYELRLPEYEMTQVTETIEAAGEWADRICLSKRSLKRFLATLTPAQLTQAEVMVDDESYIVFYPILDGAGTLAGPHFDDGEFSKKDDNNHPQTNHQPYKAEVSDYPEIEVATACQVSELTQQERQQAFNILLSSVRLL